LISGGKPFPNHEDGDEQQQGECAAHPDYPPQELNHKDFVILACRNTFDDHNQCQPVEANEIRFIVPKFKSPPQNPGSIHPRFRTAFRYSLRDGSGLRCVCSF
jgi:hypothetical protein